MNWLIITVVGASAVWFEFNYQRSKRKDKKAIAAAHPGVVPETARVAQAGQAPSISPGSENDKKLNTTA